MSEDRKELSPLDQAAAAILPGLEMDVMPMPCGDGELRSLRPYTADGLLRAHPDRYALATGLFFGANLSFNDVCRYARISPHTMQCIIAREAQGELAGRWREATKGNLRALISMAMSVGAELMANRPGDLNGTQVATLLREYVHAHELMDGRPTGRSDSAPQHTNDDARSYVDQMRRASARKESIEAEEIGGPREGDESGAESSPCSDGGAR